MQDMMDAEHERIDAGQEKRRTEVGDGRGRTGRMRGRRDARQEVCRE